MPSCCVHLPYEITTVKTNESGESVGVLGGSNCSVRRVGCLINARLPHAKRPPPGGYVQTRLPESQLSLQISVSRLTRSCRWQARTTFAQHWQIHLLIRKIDSRRSTAT